MEKLNKLSDCIKVAYNAGYINKTDADNLQSYINKIKSLINNRMVDSYYKGWVDDMDGQQFDHFPFKEAYSAGFNKVIDMICEG